MSISKSAKIGLIRTGCACVRLARAPGTARGPGRSARREGRYLLFLVAGNILHLSLMNHTVLSSVYLDIITNHSIERGWGSRRGGKGKNINNINSRLLPSRLARSRSHTQASYDKIERSCVEMSVRYGK